MTPYIAHRPFPSYGDYVSRQAWKLPLIRENLLAHLPREIESFARIFRAAAEHLQPGAVLCLGARSGAESLGAIRAGFTGSVGIDLHPVGPSVMRADWHDLPFKTASFPNIYSNSLDHCLYLDKFTAEVRRVLTRGGRFYVMATNRKIAFDAWLSTGTANEALYWRTSDDLCQAICRYEFRVVKAWRTGKWGHYALEVAPV